MSRKDKEPKDKGPSQKEIDKAVRDGQKAINDYKEQRGNGRHKG